MPQSVCAHCRLQTQYLPACSGWHLVATKPLVADHLPSWCKVLLEKLLVSHLFKSILYFWTPNVHCHIFVTHSALS